MEQSGETIIIKFLEYGCLGNRIKDVIGQVKEMKLIASDVSRNGKIGHSKNQRKMLNSYTCMRKKLNFTI